MKGRHHKKVVKVKVKIMNPVTSTVVITEVPPVNPSFSFAVSVSNGDSFVVNQSAVDQNTAIDQAVAELNVVIAALNAQKA